MNKNNTIISLVDFTSLNETDTNESVIKLCNKAMDLPSPVASICIYKEFIKIAKEELSGKNSNIPITTVINFSSGEQPLDKTLKELDFCLLAGADEIDLVMPYKHLINQDIDYVQKYVQEVRSLAKNNILKVIIESGELKQKELISLATKIVVDSGADFVKTSTGKVSINATLEATDIILNEIKSLNSQCGFKVAGGIKTLEQANQYIDLATKIMGSSFIKAKTFRFGTTSLIDNVLNIKSVSNY